MKKKTETQPSSKLFDSVAWGLPLDEVKLLGTRLVEFWERFADCFATATRDTSEYALDVLSGLLRMTTERNFNNLARTAGVNQQNIQHFMSHSTWEAQDVLREIRSEISDLPRFQNRSVLILDESAEEKASARTAGAGRQYNGRLGKVEMSQVGVFLAYANDGLWTWVDGELFIPEAWFKRERSKERKRLAIPPDRRFQTKVELGWQMISRVGQEGLPFDLVCGDTLYGRSNWLRRQVGEAGLEYCFDVPVDTLVYLTEPVIGVPEQAANKGRRAKLPRVTSDEKPLEVRSLAASPETQWTRIEVRNTERGKLNDEFSVRRVWTYEPGQNSARAEWLVLRRDVADKLYYALSNAPADATAEHLAWSKCQRVFIECANRDAKTELGWDELRAQRYPAWEHQLALTCLAQWFVTETRLDWQTRFKRNADLGKALGIPAEELPPLSLANVRELLRAVMPLPQLTPERATDLVIEHLLNRTSSRRSRLKTSGYKHSLP